MTANSACASPRYLPVTSSTARARHGILRLEERTGANRSAHAPVALSQGLGTSWRYGWLPLTFLSGTAIVLDSADPPCCRT
jgi:hypothetical protein